MTKTIVTGGPGDKPNPKPKSMISFAEQLKSFKKASQGKVLPRGAKKKSNLRVKINKKR